MNRRDYRTKQTSPAANVSWEIVPIADIIERQIFAYSVTADSQTAQEAAGTRRCVLSYVAENYVAAH